MHTRVSEHTHSQKKWHTSIKKTWEYKVKKRTEEAKSIQKKKKNKERNHNQRNTLRMRLISQQESIFFTHKKLTNG